MRLTNWEGVKRREDEILISLQKKLRYLMVPVYSSEDSEMSVTIVLPHTPVVLPQELSIG